MTTTSSRFHSLTYFSWFITNHIPRLSQGHTTGLKADWKLHPVDSHIGIRPIIGLNYSRGFYNDIGIGLDKLSGQIHPECSQITDCKKHYHNILQNSSKVLVSFSNDAMDQADLNYKFSVIVEVSCNGKTWGKTAKEYKFLELAIDVKCDSAKIIRRLFNTFSQFIRKLAAMRTIIVKWLKSWLLGRQLKFLHPRSISHSAVLQ